MRIGLLASSALVSAWVLMSPVQAQAQQVITPQSGPYFGDDFSGTDQPKAADGPPAEFYGDDDQDGAAGVQGGQAGVNWTIFQPGVNVFGETGFVSTYLYSNGGKGGDGGDGGNIQFGGFANGGAAGAGGSASNVTFEQQGSTGAHGVITGANLNAILLKSNGGAGGAGGSNYTFGKGGQGGQGGAAATVQFTQDAFGFVTGTQAGLTAVVLESIGGQGGLSNDARTETDAATAFAGGNGGDGGEIHATMSGSIVSAGSGVTATSRGGDGGQGGFADTDGVLGATGGQGGDGGGGGVITLTLSGGSIRSTGATGPATGASTPTQGGGTITFSEPTAAMQALTQGGRGGKGNGADGGFSKGTGGNGGGVDANSTATVNATAGSAITTSGYAAVGMLVQNIGGNGGNGGYGGGVFVAQGGSGATGGDASAAIATTNHSTIITAGDASIAMLAQSIGGGGGFGANAALSTAVVGVTLGGNGSDGGGAGGVTVYNGTPNGDLSQFTDGSVIITSGYGSHGMVGQAIGGGGGGAGDATTIAVGAVLAVAIGGTAGTGGDGGGVVLRNGYVVQTAGDDAYGMIGQSVGGGGGDGGAAYSLDVGAQLTVATAVGGNGGTGGDGNTVSVGNQGQIVTSGHNSYGMVAQSVGGGGGTGGTSLARTIQVYNDPEYPSLTLNVSLGGKGGTGGIGGDVNLNNVGAVLTNGAGAYGVLAQSIGGGGGAGGDANSLNQAYNASTFTVTTTIGGVGGKGGNSGAVLVENSGFLNTAGDGATAVYAQSVGGGGGSGGSGSADSGSYNDSDTPYSFQFTLALGGSGGAAGDGNTVTVQNEATGIVTYGHGAQGIFAQSVGGGGGDAGNASAKGGGGANNFNIGVGGDGGGGGKGGDVVVNNDAAILTTGSDSAAIYAQSIGGGGGIAGSATVGSGNSPQITLAEFIGEGMGIGEEVINIGNNIYTLAQQGQNEWNDVSKLADVATYYDNNNLPKPPTPDGEQAAGSKINVNIGGGVGGNGATAGVGGDLTVTNTGSIQTNGAASEGIYAQSVGGGGGDGGAASSANGNATLDGSFGIGGNSGSSGDGGAINVTNSGTIATSGDLSHAIFTQSVGGGGGQGGMTAGAPASYTLVTVNLGGNGGAAGDGGKITITSNGAITTNGDDAIGIVAQSLGGGGGVAGVMTQNQTGDVSDSTVVPITFSGSQATGDDAHGSGQKVEVDLTGGSITTRGRDAYGVLAQSIGGGGGLVLGVNGETDQSFFGSNSVGGNGGELDVSLSNSARIETHGDGAAGIFAQSIGGGGGLVGGLSAVNLSKGSTLTPTPINHIGQGGNINIDVQPGTRIDTYGTRAHGIFAQAAGSGGGVFGIQGGEGYIMAGRFACLSTTCPGAVVINADGDIEAHGPDSWGIYAQAEGDGAVGVTVNLLKGTGVVYGTNGGIFIDSPKGTNTVNNIGYISGNGIALETNGAATLNSGVPSGGVVTIAGDILSSGGGWNITNNVSSRLYTRSDQPGTYQTSGFTNHGEIWLGTLAANSTANITGGLFSDGRIVTGADFANGKADVLHIDGLGELSGYILINPISKANGTVTVVTTNGDLAVSNMQAADFVHNSDDSLTPVTPTLYSYTITHSDTLTVTMNIDLTAPAVAGSFNANQNNIANYLQNTFVRGASSSSPRLEAIAENAPLAIGADALVAALLERVATPQQYVDALESLGPHTLGVAAATRAGTDRSFTGDLEACPAFTSDSRLLEEGNCVWGRIGGGVVNTSANGQSSGFNTDAGIIQFGGQKGFGEGWFVGGSLAYERSDTKSDPGFASTDGESVLAGVNVKRETGPMILSAAVTGGLGWFDSTRTIVIGNDVSSATASPKTSHFGLHAKASYDFSMGQFYVRPALNLDATYVHLDSFVESGSRFGLDVASSNDWMNSAAPSLEIGAKITRGSVVARPWLRVGAEFSDGRDWEMKARIVGTSSGLDRFSADTSMPSTIATVSIGADVISKDRLELRLEYQGGFAENFQANSGSLRLGYRF